MGEKKSRDIRSRVVELVQKAVREVAETGRPVGIEILRGENFVIQILVVPPGAARYGATTVNRERPGVLLQIRSSRLWRNALTIKSPELLDEVLELIRMFRENRELVDAVRDVMTPSEVSRPVMTLELTE